MTLALLLLLLQSPGEPVTSALYKTAEKLDTQLFHAYNTCELEKFHSLLDPAVEFYHDQGGLLTSASAVTEAVRANICGKARRAIVAGSMKVYPMKGIGFLQSGVHRFCEIQKDGSCRTVGEAQFTNLWKRTGDSWHAIRILSFDHQPWPRP
jgi:hypothetical protein